MPFEEEKFEEEPTPLTKEEEVAKEVEKEQEEKTPKISVEKNRIESMPKYQRIEDVLMEEVKLSDPGFEKAKEIHIETGETKKEIKERLERRIIGENWWLQDEWKEKGIPKEQLEIITEDQKLNVYNFGEELTDRHLEELEKVVKEFSQIKNGKFLDKAKYILINNIKKGNPYGREEQMGFSHPSAKAIELNPKGVEFAPHRIEKASSFEGTLIHEFSHNVVDEIINEWNEKFGWEFVENPTEKFPNGELKWWRNKMPEKCINSYARLSPDEDIAESIVAALRNPEALDPERLQFLKEALLLDKIDMNKASKIDIQKRSGKDIKLPELGSPLKYKVIEHDKKKEEETESKSEKSRSEQEGEKIYKTEFVDKLEEVLGKRFKTTEKNEKGETKEIVLRDVVEEHLQRFRSPEFSKLSTEQKSEIQKEFVKNLTKQISKTPSGTTWSFYFERAIKTGEMNCSACASLNGLILENTKKITELEKIEMGLPHNHAMNIITFTNGQIYYVDPRNNVFENLSRNIKVEYRNGLKVYKIKELRGGMLSKIIPTLPVKEGIINCYVDNLHSAFGSAKGKFPEGLKKRSIKELKKIQEEAKKVCEEKGINNQSYEQLKKLKEFFNKKRLKYQESREFKTEIKRIQEFHAFTKDLKPFFKLFTENKEVKREVMAKKNKITRFLLYGTVKPTLENKKAEKEFRKFYKKQRKLRESNFVQYKEFIKQVITGLKSIR